MLEELDPRLALSHADSMASMIEVIGKVPCVPDPEGGTCTAHNSEWSENTGCEWHQAIVYAMPEYRAEAAALRAAYDRAALSRRRIEGKP